MAFWTDIVKTPEPLRQYRWYIIFGNQNYLDSIRYALMEATKPEVEIASMDHLLLNHSFNYPGVLKWKPMKVKFASVRGENGDKTKDAATILHDLVKRGGYINPKENQTNHINKTSFSQEAFNNTISLIQIDEEGKTIEEWKIYNPLITNINYGTLSYSSDDIVTIDATIHYDFAELNETKQKTTQQ